MTMMLRQQQQVVGPAPVAATRNGQLVRRHGAATMTTTTTSPTVYVDTQQHLLTLTAARPLTSEQSAPSPTSLSPTPPSSTVLGVPADSGPALRVEEEPLIAELTQQWLEHPFERGPHKCPVQAPEDVVTISTFSAIDAPGQPPEALRNWSTYRTDLGRPYPRRLKNGDIDETSPYVWALHTTAVAGVDEAHDIVGGEVLPIKHVHSDKESWVELLTYDPPQRCYPPFPNPVLSLSHFMEMELNFTLSTTHEQLQAELAAGNMNVSLPYASVAAMVETPTIVPVTIWMLAEAGQLPLDCNVQLVSEPLVPGGERRGWFHARAPNPSFTPHPKALRLTHLVRGGRPLPPPERSAPECKFWCGRDVTTAEFVRWAATDMDQVQRELDSSEHVQKGKETARFIKDVRGDEMLPRSIPQFLCMTEWHRIVAQTELRQKKKDVSRCAIEPSGNETYTFRVDAGLMKQLVDEKRAAVNAPANIMSVFRPIRNEAMPRTCHLYLEIRPVSSEIGSAIAHSAEQQFRALTELQRKEMKLDRPGQVPITYHCSLALRYLPVPGPSSSASWEASPSASTSSSASVW